MTPIPVFAAAVGPAEILAVFVLASAVLAGLLAAA